MAGCRFNIRMRHLESDVAVSVQNGFSGGNVMQVAIKSLCVKDACVALPIFVPVNGFLHIIVKHGRQSVPVDLR